MEWSKMNKKEKSFRKIALFTFSLYVFTFFCMFAIIAVTNSDVIGGMPYFIGHMSEILHLSEVSIKLWINVIICSHTFLSFAMIFITIKICEMNYKKKQGAKSVRQKEEIG